MARSAAALQARMPASADDDVIVHGDTERRGDIDDRAGHLDIRLRWRRIAGRVIVQQSFINAYRIELANIFVEVRSRWSMGQGSVVGDQM